MYSSNRGCRSFRHATFIWASVFGHPIPIPPVPGSLSILCLLPHGPYRQWYSMTPPSRNITGKYSFSNGMMMNTFRQRNCTENRHSRDRICYSLKSHRQKGQLHPAIQKTLQDVNSKDFRKCLRPRAQLLWSSCIVVVDSVIPCMSSLAFRKDWNLFGILL